MFLGDHFSGVYRSNDGGQTWFASNAGLRTREINELAFSSDGLHLYAATEGEGVYRLDLDGQPPEGAAPPPTRPEAAPEPPDEQTPSLPCLGGFVPIALIGVVLVWRRKG